MLSVKHGPFIEVSLFQLIVAQWCHMSTYIWVNIGSDNGLVPRGNKP